MDFKTDSQTVSFQSIKDQINKTDIAADNYKSSTNYGFNTSNSVYGGNFSTVGLNASHIPTMKVKLHAFIRDIKAELSNIQNLSEEALQVAFKGEYATSFASYLQTFELNCKKIVDGLIVFDSRLTEIAKAYENVSTNLASNISSGKDAIDSNFSDLNVSV